MSRLQKKKNRPFAVVLCKGVLGWCVVHYNYINTRQFWRELATWRMVNEKLQCTFIYTMYDPCVNRRYLYRVDISNWIFAVCCFTRVSHFDSCDKCLLINVLLFFFKCHWRGVSECLCVCVCLSSTTNIVRTLCPCGDKFKNKHYVWGFDYDSILDKI